MLLSLKNMRFARLAAAPPRPGAKVLHSVRPLSGNVVSISPVQACVGFIKHLELRAHRGLKINFAAMHLAGGAVASTAVKGSIIYVISGSARLTLEGHWNSFFRLPFLCFTLPNRWVYGNVDACVSPSHDRSKSHR